METFPSNITLGLYPLLNFLSLTFIEDKARALLNDLEFSRKSLAGTVLFVNRFWITSGGAGKLSRTTFPELQHKVGVSFFHFLAPQCLQIISIFTKESSVFSSSGTICSPASTCRAFLASHLLFGTFLALFKFLKCASVFFRFS